MNFENKKYKVTVNGEEFEVHVSRIIASWNNVADVHAGNYRFEEWLETLGLSEQDIRDIEQFAINGKLELEKDVTRFLQQQAD